MLVSVFKKKKKKKNPKVKFVGTQAQIYIGPWACLRRYSGSIIDQQ